MVRRVTNWVAGVVLGLSVLGWGASYLGMIGLPAPGNGVLILDSGALRYGEIDRTVPPPRPVRMRWALPFWIPLMLSSVALWAVWRIGYERRQLAMAGCCGACGYDLTGIDGMCPECGAGPTDPSPLP